MKARVLAQADVLKITDLLRGRGYEVLAPFGEEGRDSFFDTVTDANRGQVQIHLPNPYYPPKRYVFPHIERLLKVKGKNGEMKIEPTYEEPRRAIFGIRSCDVAGLWHLDRFFLGRDFRDVYYEKRRKNLFLVNVVCTDPERDISEDCFCLCTDTGPAARDHFDLQLMDLGDGEFMAVAGTAAGEELFTEPIFHQGTDAHVERRKTLLTEVRKRFRTTTSWFSATVRYISQGAILEKTWEEIGNRCLECGGCTNVCPACTCFHRLGPPGGAGRNRAGADLGFLRFGRLYAHGGRIQPAPRGA
jgi:hypothetical protein